MKTPSTARALAAALLLSSALVAPRAEAQHSWAVEALIRGSSDPDRSQSFPLDAQTTRRYAIVIGNGGYENIPRLRNAVADARAMAGFLEKQGYSVNFQTDITKHGFEDILRQALFDIDRNTEVAVFFAGHGFQIGAENYLVPVDADMDSVYDVPFEAVSLGSLVGIIGSRARLQVVMLDSCRDNPFAGKSAVTQIGNELRETRTGFASQAAPLNSSLIFSTSPGSVAYDGQGENSPFTEALLQVAGSTPEAPITQVFEKVRRAVFETTKGRQVPWDSSTLVEPASFGLTALSQREVSDAAADVGASRGFAEPASIAVASALRDLKSVSGGEGRSIEIFETTTVLEAPLANIVDIGAALKDALRLSDSDVVEIEESPAIGRLVLSESNGFRRSASNNSISGADLGRLKLETGSVQVRAADLERGALIDSMSFNLGGVSRQVALQLTPNACDFHAGDHLDPDGIGITRYANEIEPEAALLACQQAIADEPEVGRFHYQLGRAHTALRQFDAARDAYETARVLGHARAWNALGNAKLNEARETGGKVNPIADTDVLEMFARGVDAGDPYAYYSLGRQFMKFGENRDIETEGYDLMMRSLEVGHTFAMNELGYFYLDENSPYYDPERGLRYLRESASREDIYGFNNMGLVHLRGLGGTEVDLYEAFTQFTKAAEGGHPNAPGNLGRMYREGQTPVGRDAAKAVEWFSVGLERGDALSGGTAAFMIAAEGVEGYDLLDAAVLGAKSAALSSQASAAKSRELLTKFPPDALQGGMVRLLSEMGADISEDAPFDATARAELSRVLGVNPETATREPVETLISLASAYWAQSTFRVDLY
ncbi:MAG: caspase family protein [Pseudomonadota bacterium]